MRRPSPKGTGVGYAPRTWGRLVGLLIMVVLIVFLAVRVRSPRGWSWLAAGKPGNESGTTTSLKPPQERQSIDPDREKLQGAADREPFLLENKDFLVRDERWQRQRKDADARYELLLYAKESKPGSLFADARSGVGFTDLLDRPDAFRGEILFVRGDLLWVTPMEMKRSGIGMTKCYQGLITVDHPERAYWILFTELPPELAAYANGSLLNLPHVEFAGYFYKVLATDPLPGRKEPRYLPVLVGQSLKLPPTASPTDDLTVLLGIFLTAAMPILLIGIGAWWLYRRTDGGLQAKMAEVRQRVEARNAEAVAGLDAQEGAAPGPQVNGSLEPPPVQP
jgi:hypothetical protein